MSNFRDMYLNGEIQFDTINDFIGEWHDSPTTTDLHDYLGLTFEEYAAWVEKDEETFLKLLQNNRLLERIRKWQEEPVFHELTCGNDSRHNVLKGRIENKQVILACEDCDYKQNHIPDLFLSKQFEDMYNNQLKLIKNI